MIFTKIETAGSCQLNIITLVQKHHQSMYCTCMKSASIAVHNLESPYNSKDMLVSKTTTLVCLLGQLKYSTEGCCHKYVPLVLILIILVNYQIYNV